MACAGRFTTSSPRPVVAFLSGHAGSVGRSACLGGAESVLRLGQRVRTFRHEGGFWSVLADLFFRAIKPNGLFRIDAAGR